jgi:putative addiction module component (TIGR02574 family)
MSQKLDRISNDIMTLDPEERAELAERIWESVTAEDQADIDNAWRAEIERRIEQADKRGTPGTPADQVLNEIERELRERP